MSGTDIVWEGGEHRFLLTIKELRALQTKCDAGPAFILMRLQSGQWRVDDIIETVRLGLIGGGLKPDEARKLVTNYVEEVPLSKTIPLAQAILMDSILGPEDDPAGELDREMVDQSENHSQTEKSDGPTS